MTQIVAEVGQSGLHFHDLRHTGNTLAAQTGTSLRDLMARMGHDNPRAVIYQHATSGADRAVAAALDAVLKAQEAGAARGRTGGQGGTMTGTTGPPECSRRWGSGDGGGRPG